MSTGLPSTVIAATEKPILFRFEFDPPSPKGWSIKGMKFEEDGGLKRPILLFSRSKLDSTVSLTQRDLAVAIRLAKEKKRPKFEFINIPDGHPMAGEQYCYFTPQWLRGTNFGKVMVEGDWVMKQLAHNVRIAADGSYTSWESTSKLRGLKTSFDFYSIPISAPFYLSCKHVKVYRNKDSITFLNDPKMEIMMENNPDYWTYITSVYDSVAYYDAPELEQIKELPKLILLAEWLVEQGVSIDTNWLAENTRREKSACPTIRHMPGPRHSPNRTFDDTVFLPEINNVLATQVKPFLECFRREVAQAYLANLRRSLTESDVEDLLPNDVDMKMTKCEIEENGNILAEMIETYYKNGKIVRKVACTVRGAINDDDFVCANVSPRMPVGRNLDGSLIFPDVDSWKELRSEVILPFFRGLYVQKGNENERGWEAQRQSWGGCSMQSFAAQPTKRCSSHGEGVAEGSSYKCYKNGVVGSVAKLESEKGRACINKPVEPAQAKSSYFAPPRDVGASAPLTTHNEKVIKSRKGQYVSGQQNPKLGTGYLKGDASGEQETVKMAASMTEKVLEGPGKGSMKHRYTAFGIPTSRKVLGENKVMLWASNYKKGNTADKIKDDCSICYEGLLIKDKAMMECGHLYHAECIEKWFKQGESTCPLCREPSAAKIVQ